MVFSKGESYRAIIWYWLPELISATILVTLPVLLDNYLIGQLLSRSTYGALSNANTILHLLTKLAESIAVASITVIGSYNGSKEFKKAGAALGDTFWTTILLGFIPFIILFCFSTDIYIWLNVPQNMAVIGSPFLRLRAFGVFLSFLYLAFFGFMRGIKNTKTPMKIYLCGMSVFLLVDYMLVLGKWGMPQLGLMGSAIAHTCEYSLMVILAIIHIVTTPEYKKYFPVVFWRMFNRDGALRIVNMSWPIMLDKASLAVSLIYLQQLLNPLGKNVIAAASLIKDLERLALLPGIAFATVLTFLVSNSVGAHNIPGARANIRKVLLLTIISIISLVLILCIKPSIFMNFFDPRNKFAPFAISVYPVIAWFIVLDFVQLIFAAALRGAGDVLFVMITRVCCCVLFFWPISSWFASFQLANHSTQFILTYSSIYLTTGLMGIIFFLRLRSNRWYKELEHTTHVVHTRAQSTNES